MAAARLAVQAQTVRLTTVQARRRRATAAVLAERDDIAQLKAAIVAKEIRAQRARKPTSANLAVLHKRLVHEAAVLDAQAARARTLSSGGAVAPPAGCTNGPFVPTVASSDSSRRREPTTRSTRSRSSRPGSTSSARRCSCI